MLNQGLQSREKKKERINANRNKFLDSTPS